MDLAARRDFEAYGTTHVSALAVFALGAVVVVLLGRRIGRTPSEQVVRRTFAIAIACFAIPVQAIQLLPGEWDLQTSLPLHLCDLAWMVAVHALWTGHQLSATIIYLWGISLTTQGMLTPELSSDFPDPRFLMFWGMHMLIVWASFFLVVGLRILPTWHTYRQTVAVTLGWAAATYVFNIVVGTNYGFLNRLPRTASLLDLLGPWPVYVVLANAILLAGWALLTWPWTLPSTAGPATRNPVRGTDLP
ncbi:MAG: TIGR02206 family membrane protein [Aeromicrobium sp.]